MHLKEKVKTSELFFLDFTFLNKSWSILLSLQSRTVITLGFLNSSSFNSKLLNAGILNQCITKPEFMLVWAWFYTDICIKTYESS